MIDEGPGEHDAHLMDDGGDDTAACPKCGGEVWAHAHRCDHCGVHFTGEAWHGEIAGGEPSRSWVWWAAVAVLIAFLIGLLTWGDIL